MLLDFLRRLRRAAKAPQTGIPRPSRPIGRVRFGRLQVPAHAVGLAGTGVLAGQLRVHRRPDTGAAAAVTSALASAVRFAPVPLQRRDASGLTDAGSVSLAGTWRSSRRAAEIARENDRLLLELGEL